jgi:hypothetical protein
VLGPLWLPLARTPPVAIMGSMAATALIQCLCQSPPSADRFPWAANFFWKRVQFLDHNSQQVKSSSHLLSLAPACCILATSVLMSSDVRTL